MIYQSPLGPLALIGDSRALRRVLFPPHAPAARPLDAAAETLLSASLQLDQYFSGTRRVFDLPLELHGTSFQRQVWRELEQIPHGETTTYGALARRLGEIRAGEPPEPRAVAAAIARTPVPIVIPCHRVIGSDGSLTGYGGGLRRKQALLDFEATGGDRAALDATWLQRQLTLL